MKLYMVELRSTAGVFGLWPAVRWLEGWAEALKPKWVERKFIRLEATEGQLERLKQHLKRHGVSAVSIEVVGEREDDWECGNIW